MPKSKSITKAKAKVTLKGLDMQSKHTLETAIEAAFRQIPAKSVKIKIVKAR